MIKIADDFQVRSVESCAFPHQAKIIETKNVDAKPQPITTTSIVMRCGLRRWGNLSAASYLLTVLKTKFYLNCRHLVPDKCGNQ